MMNKIKHSLDEATLNTIQQILPQIEKQITLQLEEQLSRQFAQQFEKDLQQLQNQADAEYQQALHTLQEESLRLQHQKIKQYEEQITMIEINNQTKLKKQTLKLQSEFINDNFNQLVLSHQKILSLETELEESIIIMYQEKFEGERDRKLRQLRVKIQQRQERLRKQKERLLKQKQLQTNGTQELKNDIELLRVGIASMKSEYNVKIRKIDEEIKDYRKRCKELENQNIKVEDLKAKIEQIKLMKQREQKQKLLKQEQKENLIMQIEEEQQNQTESFNENYLQKHINEKYIWQKHNLSNNKIQNNVYDNLPSIISSFDFSQYPSQEQDKIRFLNHDIVESQQQEESGIKQRQKQNNRQRIIDVNIGELLREKWEVNPLEKYFLKENDAGNNSGFRQKYMGMLNKMGKGLSEKTKKAIIKNLSK